MKKYIDVFLHILKKYKYAIVTLILVSIVGDILLANFYSDLISFTILAFTVILFNFYKFDPKKIFVLSLIPIIVIFFGFVIAPESREIEKAATWLFLLMATGIIQEILWIKKNERI